MVRAVGQDSFQPRIGFKTRYGMIANPFAEGLDQGLGRLTPNNNVYYRRVAIKNLMWSIRHKLNFRRGLIQSSPKGGLFFYVLLRKHRFYIK